MRIMRHFVPLASGIQLHYRRAGNGPPVILLHPSPQSGTFSLPMLRRLATRFTAIALDTPGYGLSDPLPGDPAAPQLADYVAPLKEFLDALGIERAAFYGNATGAEILHLFAHAHPERVALCMIDTAGHKEDADLDKMLRGYFPDVTPRRDGGHLLTHWDMVRSLSLYSPWHASDAAHRLAIDLPPPEVLQVQLLDYLRAGAHYAAAYRPAFYTAKHALISRVRVPATLMRWLGKPDLSEVDALVARGLPPNFTVLHAGPTVEERQAVNERYLIEHYLPSGPPAPAVPAQLAARLPRLQKLVIDAPGGELCARACLAGDGPPLLALPDAFGSGRALAPLLAHWIGRRPVIALDYPGAGDSDPCAPGAISITAWARAALASLDALVAAGLIADRPCDLLGSEAGGLVALEFERLAPARVHRLALLRPWLHDEADLAELRREYAPDLSPRWDGAHLVTSWSIVRDMELFEPWYRRRAGAVRRRDADLDAARLDARTQDLLKIGAGWQAACASAFDYPVRERLAALRRPCVLADERGARSLAIAAQLSRASPGAPMGIPGSAATGAAPGASGEKFRTLELPADSGQWGAALAAFLAEGNPAG